MKLKKELVDEVIRLNIKYYKTGDTDLLPALFEAENQPELNGKTTDGVVDLISDITKFMQCSGRGTNEDIYKVLAIFGVIVE